MNGTSLATASLPDVIRAFPYLLAAAAEQLMQQQLEQADAKLQALLNDTYDGGAAVGGGGGGGGRLTAFVTFNTEEQREACQESYSQGQHAWLLAVEAWRRARCGSRSCWQSAAAAAACRRALAQAGRLDCGCQMISHSCF
jgi:hypothetical protein